MENTDILDHNLIDLEVSKLKLHRRQRIKCTTMHITFVSLLLSISTAVGLINVLIPFGPYIVNIGFTLKYYVLAISFQVVGLYWGMIIGLLDGLIQFLIYGNILFRLISGFGLMLWVFVFWLFFEKLFKPQNIENKSKKTLTIVFASFCILLIEPIIQTITHLIYSWITLGTNYIVTLGIVQMIFSYISFFIFDVFAIILFTTTTSIIGQIVKKYEYNLRYI